VKHLLWIKELSIRLVASEGSLLAQCNWRGRVVEVQKVNNKVSIRYLTHDKRLTFDNQRLFDMHSLTVLKGEEARTRMENELSGAVEEGTQDLSSLGMEIAIPTSLPIIFMRDLGKLYVDERRLLDFATKSVEYDLGREFIKDRPGMVSERRLKLTVILNDNRGLHTTHWLESGRGEVGWVNGSETWTYEVEGFREILSSLKPTSEAYQELKRYMHAFVNGG